MRRAPTVATGVVEMLVEAAGSNMDRLLR